MKNHGSGPAPLRRLPRGAPPVGRAGLRGGAAGDGGGALGGDPVRGVLAGGRVRADGGGRGERAGVRLAERGGAGGAAAGAPGALDGVAGAGRGGGRGGVPVRGRGRARAHRAHQRDTRACRGVNGKLELE